MIHTLRNLAADLDVGAAAAHSFRDFHAKGVDYICLHRTPSLTIKLYQFDPDTLVTAGPGIQVVNPHSHRYNFSTHVLRGVMTNVEYEKAGGTRNWHEFRYRATLDGPPTSTYAGPCKLRRSRWRRYSRGDSYAFDRDGVHSIEVSMGVRTALLLFQHASWPASSSLLYTRNLELPPMAGLYSRWTTDDIRRSLTRLLEEI